MICPGPHPSLLPHHCTPHLDPSKSLIYSLTKKSRNPLQATPVSSSFFVTLIGITMLLLDIDDIQLGDPPRFICSLLLPWGPTLTNKHRLDGWEKKAFEELSFFLLLATGSGF
ncbi:hypothetical protein M413DRAFT_332801 [Hebeloma cylindrosporum]|uniref:Uncharacterized protein n=1 Tax=Hebeloma cylindrosporum TaxID=76867 RepID=A0A0C2YW17_HEBCY|nr:hypothetical protein M413DRAFT_332801 [Hebeloma cylindrosporum h7]